MRLRINPNQTRIPTLPVVALCTWLAMSCSNNNSDTPADDTDAAGSTGTSDTINTGDNPDTGDAPAAANPVPLDPNPQPTVELTEDNALIVASAVYRVERTLAWLMPLSIEVDRVVPDNASTSTAALSLGNAFCTSGDGLAQAMSPSASYAGAVEPVMVSFNNCAVNGLSVNGGVALSQYNDGEQDWLVVEPRALEVQLFNESVRMESGRFRISLTDGESTPIESVGTSLDIVMAGYLFTLAPFEASVNAATGEPVITEQSMSLASELFGGIVFSKPSASLAIAVNGQADSGGNTIRGSGSPVIEWFAGATTGINGGAVVDTLTDLRSGSGQTILTATWDEFLSAF